MNIIKGNIWEYRDKGYIVVTTNGSLSSKDEAIMGRGIALQAKGLFPELPSLLAGRLQTFGNSVALFKNIAIITFPVKHQWYENADLKLIKRSWIELCYVAMAREFKVFMPKPGCHNGGLKWEDVEPILTPWPDNFTLVDWK